ncbi:unnamed protein product, partial [Iphiclides podalirius]
MSVSVGKSAVVIPIGVDTWIPIRTGLALKYLVLTWSKVAFVAVIETISEADLTKDTGRISHIETVQVDVTGMTKEQRTKIHDAVKKAFGTSIVGSTVAVDDKKIVRFEKYRKGVRRDNRVKWVWPAEYVYFIVHKENCDTMEAAARLAEKLRLNIKPSMLGYAGTKDRRAKTSQWFSLRKVDPRKIAAAAKDIRDVHVGNFSFSPISLKLGMLRGNRFRIALRNVTAPDDVVAEACSRLQRHGFINYYGLQRFGSRPNAPTYEVGRLLLQADYRQAIKHIVADEEMVRMGGARGAGGARLLRALDANPRDMLGALDQLARNQRVLYLHAYQSLVWNRCASERLRRLGLAPAKGDLVPLHPDAREYENEQESEDEIKEEDESITEDNDIETPIADADKDKEVKEVTAENPEKKVQTKNEPKPKVPMKVLTEEDVASGNYTIFDVVLPVPGYNIEYPPNMVDYYKELLEKDNLKLEMRHKNKSFSLCGAYRSLAVRPGALRWQTSRYSEPTADLLLSDLQRLRGAPAAAPGQPDGPYKALLLTMTLPASSYATMALRELMKVDTANDSQALQNDYHKRPHAAATALVKPSEELKAPKAEEEESAADGAQEETSMREALSIQGGAEETRDDVEMKQGVASEPNGDRAEKRKMEDEAEEGVKKPKQEVDNAEDGK